MMEKSPRTSSFSMNKSTSNETVDQASSSASIKSSFPMKLHQLLENAEVKGYDSVVSWLPQGHAFQVYKPKEFTDRIMKDFFRQTKFQSFTRQLYLYGFVKVRFGVERGGFYHPNFTRDDKISSFSIERIKNLDQQHSTKILKGSSSSCSVDFSATASVPTRQSILESSQMTVLHPELRLAIEDEKRITLANSPTNKNIDCDHTSVPTDIQRTTLDSSFPKRRTSSSLIPPASPDQWSPSSIDFSLSARLGHHPVVSTQVHYCGDPSLFGSSGEAKFDTSKTPNTTTMSSSASLTHYSGGVGSEIGRHAARRSKVFMDGADLSWFDTAMLKDLEPRRIEDMLDQGS